MDSVIKILLLLATVVVCIWVDIYGFYKPMKGDDKLTLGKILCMIPIFVLIIGMEVFVLLIIIGL